ncbi:S8 family serine peptidase [Actinomyces sp. HPA0247]|uniref:S8 family peptidase n=1 Tax=Actinomyces sp. HPA0247 TaxID=1203556 RepID=UPI00336A28FD
MSAGALALAPAPAHADEITSQEYVSYYHLDQARAKGHTGKGVTVALIDEPVNLSDPELAGANITDKSRCTIIAKGDKKDHGNQMAALLVSQKYGVAPDATLYTYQAGQRPDDTSGCETATGYRANLDILINQAIDDGAQIISISATSEDRSPSLMWAVARAMNEGVIILAGAGNSGAEDTESLGRWSGVVGVSAVNADRSFASYSSYGPGVTTAAFGGPINVRNVDTGAITTTQGTSNATAIAAGFMAMARQKWPSASANQLLQLLVKNSLNPNHDWNQYTGYGAIDGASLMRTDPSQYPDENPLADKGTDSHPTPEERLDLANEVISPLGVNMADSYVYRGFDESIAYSSVLSNVPHIGTSPRYHQK